MNIPRDKISAEDAEKIHNLATQITFKVADCGPVSEKTIDGMEMQTTRIPGFEPKKAREIIEKMIFDFILRGY